MYHPTRGGARGGAAEFSWDKVKESKDREFYLGNSVAAPTGRWQDGRDINWYNKDASSSNAADERREELRKIKEAEMAALYAKLGKAPPTGGAGAEVRVGERLASGSGGVGRSGGTGANTEVMKDGKRWGKQGEEVSEADKKLARKFARDEG
uniref:Multiple myeloma tumor-associated protein 2-like N-terminal domain-containing protein n=1 Tax=Kalmanozyma brasiliensis (strain GHG001) TaxID=1365824 RepID=V5EGQ4_KALBG